MSKTLTAQRLVSAEVIECPACRKGVQAVSYVYQDNGQDYPVYDCPDCSFMFIRPLPIQELNERQMDSLGDAELFGSDLMKFLHRTLYINKEIRTIKKLTGGDVSLLDVGCGTGWISSLWKKAGFRVVGLEPSAVRGAYANETYGIEVINDYVENISLPDHFDVAILRHVIEHFQDPITVMEKVRFSLNADGLALVVVPNIDCIGRYLFGTDWEWVLPWHCNFFNEKSLQSMLETAGFEVLSIYQTASPLYYSDSLARKINLQFFSQMIDRIRVPVMLASSPMAMLGLILGLGDNLTAVARVVNQSESP
ncbi:MAG: class I SAM-dependent methyltransferase [Desulfuromonas sp.]|nr:MAG: class I SAM-dependent methyltransferase [Desulfuromonas sp.]